MSINQKVLGLIFASIHDSTVIDLTKLRTMGSIPFGGRYRAIDFPLSSMVNSGITEVGVITTSNYASLMDHLGSGREWDLARKSGGLHLLPPFSQVGGGTYQGRLEALGNIVSFINHTRADYIVLSNCDVITNIDFSKVLEAHQASGADLTAVYAKGLYDRDKHKEGCIFLIDKDDTIQEVLVNPMMSGECNISLDMFVCSTEFLKKVVADAMSRNQKEFVRDFLQAKEHDYVFKAYEHKGVYFKIDSLESYCKANLALLDAKNRDSLFDPAFPIYTKTGDNAPVKYGLESSVKHSLIADGCMIEGTVENSVLFRGVKVGKGTVVRNSILMQATEIGDDCTIDNVIADKNVTVSGERVLTGSTEYPLYLGKRAKI